MGVAESQYRFGMQCFQQFLTKFVQGAAREIESTVIITIKISGEMFYVIGYVSLRYNLLVIRVANAHMTQHNRLLSIISSGN